MNYTLNRTAPDTVRRICEKYKVSFLCANIFARRGITTGDEIKFYLESGLNYLHSPFYFTDMEEAVERILSAREEKESIAVFGDRDADGITSTALLAKELRSMDIEVFTHLPQGDEPYGLTMKAVDEIKAEGASLVITVDCGISCNAEIDALNHAGIDVIVVDHHIAGEDLPDALALINPKVASSGYPFEHLAGCAVTSKLIWALRFASTPLYRSRVILLHSQPGPGEDTTTIVQAVELYNLVPVSRVVEELPNRAVDFSSSRLVRLLTRNIPIMVLDKETELRQLKAAFGSSADISLIELRGELESVIPRVRGKSLFTLTTESRAALYADGHSEIETLLSLFTSCCIYKYPSLSRDYVRILDLVAVGTIADLMPLTDENRILVRLGLKELSSRPRENLIQLLSAQNLLSHPLCAQDIGWYLSPVINASGRLGCPQVALDLLLTEDKQEMYDLTMKLLSLNKERQKRGEDAWNESRQDAKASLESFGSKFLLLDTGRTPRGLTGSLASRALNEFTSAPAVIVLSQCEGDRISASIRSRESLNCRDFLSKFSSFFIDFGGHKRAGGFSMKIENKDGFKKALEEEVMKMDIGGEEEEGLSVDAMISENDMNLNLMKVVELFEPYGEANKPLVFLFSGAKIVDIITLGDPSKGNIKLTLQIGRTLWPCLWWGGRNSEGFDYEAGDTIKLVFRLNRNYYKGMDNVQLTLLQCEKENPAR